MNKEDFALMTQGQVELVMEGVKIGRHSMYNDILIALIKHHWDDKEQKAEIVGFIEGKFGGSSE